MVTKFDYKSMVITLAVSLLIAVSIFLSFDKYFIHKNFIIDAKVPCNQETGSCFVEECDIGSPTCTDEGLYYFKITQKKASVNLSPIECEFQNKCEVIYCSDSNVLDYSQFDECQ